METLGQMAQGMPDRVQGTNTIMFINREDIPTSQWENVTYRRAVVR